METILSSDKQESVRNMLSTREHISRSKTNDVSPFRKYIGRERYERLMRVCVCARASGGEKFEGGEGRGDLTETGIAVFHRGEDRFAVLKA